MTRSAPLPDLSVIIVNRNTRELLRACLASLRENGEGLALEVIVVDNGSSDGSVELVRDRFPESVLIRNEQNTGFAYPNNQGIAVSRGRYLMLLNSDTEVRPGALRRLVGFMDAHPEAGACGPRLLYPDGRLQRSVASFPTLWLHLCDMLLLDRLFPGSRIFSNMEEWFDHAATRPVEHLMGAALLVRREAIDEVGPLDECFRIHFNDVDWCWRIHHAGLKLYFVHDAEIMHHGSVTTRNENVDLQLQAELMRNTFDYYRKRFGRAGVLWLRAWMVVGYGARRAVCAVPSPLKARVLERCGEPFLHGALRAAWTGNPDQFVSQRP
jgi:GT2 family glycosyltransferase